MPGDRNVSECCPRRFGLLRNTPGSGKIVWTRPSALFGFAYLQNAFERFFFQVLLPFSPVSGAVPLAHFILVANRQHHRGALVHGAGRIRADARHRGGHLNPTAFLRAAHAAILRRGPILNCAGQTRQVTQVSYHEKGNRSEQQTTLGIFIAPIPLRLCTQCARPDARRA